MKGIFLGEFKILILGLIDLPTNELGDAVFRCSDLIDLQNALIEYNGLTITIVCRSDQLIELDVLLGNRHVDKLYVLNIDQDQEFQQWLDGLIFIDTTYVHNEKQLMRRLCTSAMLSYYNQGTQYRKQGENAVANSYMLASLKALDYATKFL